MLGAHHIDHIKADERLEQAQVGLCQNVPCKVALLAQNLFAAVQRLEELPASAPGPSQVNVDTPVD